MHEKSNNYIIRLQGEATSAQTKIAATEQAIRAFRMHLQGEKFQGFEADGSRKDWIAVSDVLAWLTIIKDGAPEQPDEISAAD
jgi:hypothetical protein